MVQIQEQEEQQPQGQQHQHHRHHIASITQPQQQQQHQGNQPPPPLHTTMNQLPSSSDPPAAAPIQTTDSPNSSSSSISSDHTFHGFSPVKETPGPTTPTPPSPPIQAQAQAQAQALVPVNRFQQPDAVTVTVAKTDPKPQSKPEIPVPRRPNKSKLFTRVGFVLRLFQILVCLVSFSVMAADKNRGWALDSFDNYTEFRYSMSVNVIGFAYSGLQVLYLLYQLTTSKIFGSQVRYSFDFAIDQVLAYLLLSASSSAFARVDDWISNWGSDEFPSMASASVGVSFVAFIAFALSSLISGYLLCTHRFT